MGKRKAKTVAKLYGRVAKLAKVWGMSGEEVVTEILSRHVPHYLKRDGKAKSEKKEDPVSA